MKNYCKSISRSNGVYNDSGDITDCFQNEVNDVTDLQVLYYTATMLLTDLWNH